MRTLNNEYIIQRGESFTMDKLVVNRDGSPYIVSNRLNNPYVVVTVSNSRYEQSNRYIHNSWLSLVLMPVFTQTTTEEISEWPVSTLPDGFSYGTGDLPVAPVVGTDNETLYYLNDCVFGCNGEYKYAVATRVGSAAPYTYTHYGYIDYSFHVIKTFLQEETRGYVEKMYFYSINLLSGQSTTNYLNDLVDVYNDTAETPIDGSNMSNQELYEELLRVGVEFPTDFDVTAPLYGLDVKVPLLVPTNMTVLSSLNGGM